MDIMAGGYSPFLLILLKKYFGLLHPPVVGHAHSLLLNIIALVSVLFREAFSHPYIFFNLLVNGFFY